MSIDFTAVDFETANSYRGSPCSVGLVKVRNGEVVAETTTLIRPPTAAGHFDRFNVSLHGITADMVANAPTWCEVLPWMVDFIGDDVVVCHNAGFDIGVLRYACAADNVPWPALSFLCTLVAARRSQQLPSYRLPFVAKALGVPLPRHHDAADDARAAALIAVAMGRLYPVGGDIHALAAALGVYVGRMAAGVYSGCVHISTGTAHRLTHPDINPDADPDHALYGQVMVFTGALMTMTRQIAWDTIAQLGAIAEPGVTKRTNILVIGDLNPATLTPGLEMTAKTAKVFRLQAKGQPIELMTEDDFVRAM